MSENVRKHPGSCFCRRVRFSVEVDPTTATKCNCTICTKIGQSGAIVKPAAFELLQGQDDLSTLPNAIGKRFFCKHCGVHCYGSGNLPELGGEFVSVNLNCLDDVDPYQLPIRHWDGRHDNWQAGPRGTPWPIFAS